jgi:hypothetical protein
LRRHRADPDLGHAPDPGLMFDRNADETYGIRDTFS